MTARIVWQRVSCLNTGLIGAGKQVEAVALMRGCGYKRGGRSCSAPTAAKNCSQDMDVPPKILCPSSIVYCNSCSGCAASSACPLQLHRGCAADSTSPNTCRLDSLVNTPTLRFSSACQLPEDCVHHKHPAVSGWLCSFKAQEPRRKLSLRV